MKKLLASTVSAALALGGLLVATAAPASAHTPVVVADCDSLDVSLTAYKGGHGTTPNTVTVTVDGEERASTSFGRSYTETFDLDPTAGHTWAVDVTTPDGYDWSDDGTTTACPSAGPDEVQVGVYLYEKLDPSRRAAWENSGPQRIVDDAAIERPARPWDLTWLIEPLDAEAVAQAAREISGQDVPFSELCTAWGVQHDLVGLSPDEYTLPDEIEYSPDGNHKGNFPPGTLIAWDHRNLVDLLPEGTCDDARTPPTTTPPDDGPEDRVVVPEAPVALEVCGATAEDVVLPADTEDVRYVATSAGVVAELAGQATFGEDLGGYTVLDGGRTALLPIEDLVPTAEECALVPGAIDAICEADVPYLTYEVALPEGIEVDDEAPLTITFLHPRGGENYVVADQPLAGSVLWPGASATEPQQWPGFVRNEDGSYTQTEGNYAWTREGVQVLFEVNPSYSTVVDYPPASSECADPPVAPVAAEDVTLVDDDDQLASTGATVAGAAAFAVLLVAGGVLVFWLRRRVTT